MEAINYSKIKEALRQNNVQRAREKENRIMQNVEYMEKKLVPKNLPIPIGCGIALAAFAAIGGFILFFTPAFLGGIAAFILGIIEIIIFVGIKKHNDRIWVRKAEIKRQAAEDVKQAYIEADNQTRIEIAAYEREVNLYAQKTMSNAENLTPMVDHSIQMFERMIGHKPVGSNMKFIEAFFKYEVMDYGIVYVYESTYSNPMSNFNFDKQRYRNLSSPAECEGLAQTLARLIIAGMKKRYPPNSITITLWHNDAEVTLHFKSANRSFVPAKDIY